MSDLEHNPLDPPQEAMVRQVLSAELDPQVGKAEARFRAFLAEQIKPGRDSLPPAGGRFRGWVFSFAGAALAACMAFFWAGPHLRFHSTPSNNPSNAVDTTPVLLPWVQQERIDGSSAYDADTYVDEDGNPLRVLRRRQWERTRFFDNNKQLRAESVVPRDDVVYVPVKTY